MILSIIIPVYNCEACLVPLYERIVQTINVLDGVTGYEIIFVEDCGQDDSWKMIETLANKDVHVRGIQFRNKSRFSEKSLHLKPSRFTRFCLKV